MIDFLPALLFSGLGLLLLSTCLILISYLRTGVVPVPSSGPERSAVIELIRETGSAAGITDMGSGWGGLCRHLTREFPETEITAVEQSWLPHLYSRIISKLKGYTTIKHCRGNFLQRPLKSDQIYITYLSPAGMRKLRKRFEENAPRQFVLISVAFAMSGWTPVKTIRARSAFHSPVYLYRAG